MLKIIAGSLRGRALRAPKGRGTRPTSARVREAIFDMLAHHPTHGCDLEGARVLDLFAGSGAMGIEAVSRGAAQAVLVERDRAAVQALRRNVAELALKDRAEVWQLDARRAVARLAERGSRFDLLLLDPPYADEKTTQQIMEALAEGGLPAAGALLVLEHAAGSDAPTARGLTEPLARRWGETEALLYRHE